MQQGGGHLRRGDHTKGDVIAATYLQLIGQHRSAWSDEITLRPWVETF